MGKAYNQSQRDHVKTLLEAGRDEDGIEKETGVSDRTIRRWKMELEKTGRIGKPPESRTGRHRVLNPEVEAALFEHVKDEPDLSVDDMLWWLYDKYKIVVGTRTIRRVFERKGEAGPRSKKGKDSNGPPGADNAADDTMEDQTPVQPSDPKYQSPYAPMNMMVPPPDQTEMNLAQALSNANTYPPPPMPMDMNDDDLPEDEETLQLELQRIELQKREVEVKLKMRRLQQGRAAQTPGTARRATTTATSSLYKPGTAKPESTGPKRDSRSKKKIEESKRRTAERQERMLKDLERRSRRREHLTSEWVQSKDIWPLRAQGMLADLMHQYLCYTYNQNSADAFEMMYRELYGLVDLQAGDWNPSVHDDMLRERMKRKMGQLRTKMQKTGEIVGRPDGGYGGWQKAANYTGEQAGQMLDGDENDNVNNHPHHDPAMHQAQAGAQQQAEEAMHYEPVPDPTQTGMQHGTPFYGNPPMMHHQPPAGYAMDPHSGMLPYGQVPQQPGMHDGGMFSG